MPPRNYTRGDRAALSLLGKGKCYWQPVCTEPLLKMVEGRYKIALQIAHIRTDKRNHERFVSNMTKEQVDSFDNLLFLCTPHHSTIDERGAEKVYTIELLERWKADRESDQYEALRGLRDVTEDRLVELIAQAQKDRNQEFAKVLHRLENSDREAAALLRELSDELAQVRYSGHLLDPDAVSLLSSAAHDLRGLMDSASVLDSAALNLRGLPDSASSLSEVARHLQNLPYYAELITSAANELQQAAARIEDARGM
jgi:hypothetical protein